MKLIPVIFLALLVAGCNFFVSLDPVGSRSDPNDFGPDAGNRDQGEDLRDLAEDTTDMTPSSPELWRQVELGYDHACGITLDGHAFCWGLGDNGRLGLGTSNDVYLPTAVSTTKAFRSITAGGRHSCAIDVEGTVYCWGHNVPLGTDEEQDLPLLMPTPNVTMRALSAGGSHTCAISDSNTVYCIGSNRYGELGNGSTNDATEFVEVTNGEGSPIEASLIGAGDRFTCALDMNGSAWCWGQYIENNVASIGTTPTRIGSNLKFVELSVGESHVCALDEEGAVYCWGDAPWFNDLLIANNPQEPTKLDTPVRFKSLASGQAFTCGIDTNDMAQCWGGNRRGKLGIGSDKPWDSVTVSISPIARVGTYQKIYAGQNFGCAMSTDNELFCWGHNLNGRVGLGVSAETEIPAKVITTQSFKQISAADYHTCGITFANEVYCWGRGNYGGQGNGRYDHQLVPEPVPDLQGGLKIDSSSASLTCVTTSDDTQCWGRNRFGSLGIGVPGPGPDTNAPRPVLFNGSFSDISVGKDVVCATAAGQGYCWGYGTVIRDEAPLINPTPRALSIAHKSYTKIAVGQGTHACGLTAEGAAYCWGANTYGQLGDGTKTTTSEPQLVLGNIIFSDIAVGTNVSCGVAIGGKGYCWGDGPEHGAGTYSALLEPTEVSGDYSWKQIDLYGQAACGVTTTGDVYCWGEQSSRRLGVAGGNQLEPVQVQGVSNAIQVSLGESFTCAVDQDGEVYCWGNKTHGHLGNNTEGIIYTPTRIDISNVE